jgi:hypothetical protein
MDEQIIELMQGRLAEISGRISSLDGRFSSLMGNLSGITSSISNLRAEILRSRAGESFRSPVSTGRMGDTHTHVAAGSSVVGGNVSPQDKQEQRELRRILEGVDTSTKELLSRSRTFSSSPRQNEPAAVRQGQFPSIFAGQEFSEAVAKRGGQFTTQELSGFRSELSGVKNLAAGGRLDSATKTQISETLGESIVGLEKRAAEILEQHGGSIANASVEARVEIARIDELIAALTQTQRAVVDSGEKQSKGIGALIASVLGTGMLQQFLMQRFVQQPYTYTTLPALSAMGNMGPMGEALSGAFGAQEAVRQSYKGMAVNAMGAVGGAAGLAMGGLAGGAIGGLIGLGAGILFKDPMGELLSSGMDKQAFNMALGKSVFNPQKFTQDVFMPTLQARMGLGLGEGEILPELERTTYGINQTTGQSDSAIPGARALGYDSVMAGRVLGNYLSVLSPALQQQAMSPENRGELINRTAQLEAFGMSKDLIFSVMSDISRAGSQDYEKSLGTLLLATSEKGEITNYTANVLVPALSKVVESRAVQNIAKSSEQVERETAGLFSLFKNSDTNLGAMLAANPEVMNRVFGMVDQISETAVQDPALMLFLNRMGVSFKDVVTGDPRTLLEPLSAFANFAEYDESGRVDLDSANNVSALAGFLTMSGIGVSTGSINLAAQMMEAIRSGDSGRAETISRELYGKTPETILEQLVERLEAIGTTEGGQIMADLVDSANTFNSLMEQNTERMASLQAELMGVFTNTEEIAKRLNEAAEAYRKEIERMTSDESPLSQIISVIKETQLFGIPNIGHAVSTGLRGAEVITNWFSGLPFFQQKATGGYTGVGNRLEPVGVVHGGEYVISDDRVGPNINTLERMQAGENFDDASGSSFSTGTSSSGDTIRVTLEFSNTSPDEIVNIARLAAHRTLREERLI